MDKKCIVLKIALINYSYKIYYLKKFHKGEEDESC